jgi:hypothetical protein
MIGVAVCSALVLLGTLFAVLPRTDSAHAQSGPTLSITKSVDADGTPLRPGDVFTYRIELAYSGGTQPIQSLFTDTLPAGIRPAAPPAVREAQTETVRPLQLQRRGRTIGWTGQMRPDSQLIVTLPMRIETCYGADRVIRNSAEAVQPDGVRISDSANITVDCFDTTIADVAVTQEVVYAQEESNDVHQRQSDSITAAATAFDRYLVPGKPATLRITIRNIGTGPLILGVDDDGTDTGCPPWCCLTCTLASQVFATDLALPGADASSSSAAAQQASIAPGGFVQLTLDPGEARTLERPIRGGVTVPDIGEQGEYAYISTLTYCLIDAGAAACPDPAQNSDLAATHTQQFPLRPNDLGDAADSSNHAGSAMTAYSAAAPAAQATYPTVFDPATGLPPGPRHVYPQFFHLGGRVSLEAEADLGPDQDPTQNIRPNADSANHERGDDGTNPSAWPLAHCQPMQVPVRLFVNAQAHAWFADADRPAYLNIWLDANRDGDWADAETCQAAGQPTQTALEHIVIDHPIDVAALGPGAHTINVPTDVVLWPAALATQDAWVRVTLSEEPANKTLQAGDLAYGDGRGYDVPFRLGETEDYVLTPPGSSNAGADLTTNLQGRRTLTQTTSTVSALGADAAGRAPHYTATNDLWLFKIDYANLGTQTTRNGSLTFQIPQPLREGELALLSAPDIAPANIRLQPTEIRFGLPDLRVGDSGTIVLGWTGCLTCTRALASAATSPSTPAADTIVASVTAAADNDVDPSNNGAQSTLTRTALPPTIAVYAADNGLWRGSGATCRDTVEFIGRGTPNATLRLDVRPQSPGGETPSGSPPRTATVQVDGDGIWRHTQAGLPDGFYEVRAAYATGNPDGQMQSAGRNAPAFDRGYLGPYLRLNVDSALPADPMSLTIADSRGNTFQPSYAGWPQSLALVLPPGQYTFSLATCPGAEVTALHFQLGDLIIPAARECDDGSDRCGPWQAQVTIPEAMQAASPVPDVPDQQSFQIVLNAANAETTLDGSLAVSGGGVVRDRATGQALAAATVTLLEAVVVTETTGAGTGAGQLFAPWDGAEYGQANPQTTDDTGRFTLAPPAGTYRLEVTRSGYQPYRTASFTTKGDLLQQSLALTPAVPQPPDRVVQLSAAGFAPAVLTVAPDSVIAFVNVDVSEHTVRSDAPDINSGMLAPGQRFSLRLAEETMLTMRDDSNPLNSVTLIVTEDAPSTGQNVYLPLLTK